jgi:hypothetical protein
MFIMIIHDTGASARHPLRELDIVEFPLNVNGKSSPDPSVHHYQQSAIPLS